MAEIGISTVLNEINQPLRGSEPHEFSLMFIRTGEGTNGKIGQEKYLAKAQKYSKDPLREKGAGKAMNLSNLRLNSTLLISDRESGEIISVKIWSLIQYNGFSIRH